jgi:BirA family transcriptional regulator, biotin operon repressor / biotin---[acetyl-CoA-carboxylase] ligase
VREPLDVRALQEALLTLEGLWSAVDVLETVDSTNLEAARDPRLWRVVIADHQSAGRGRLTRQWVAPERASVAVSAVLPARGADVGWLPLLAGMAMGSALEDVSGLRTGLKWPNDVLVGGEKICGVLCELVSAGDAVVVGAGANVDQGREELPVPTATSLRLAGAGPVRREDLIVGYLHHLTSLHATWSRGGAGLRDLRAAYRARCVTLGQVVDVHQPSGVTLRGTAVAVDDAGQLLLDTPRGRHTHAAGDVVHVRPPGSPAHGLA